MALNYLELYSRLHKLSNKTKITQFGIWTGRYTFGKLEQKHGSNNMSSNNEPVLFDCILSIEMTSDGTVHGVYGFLTSRAFRRVQERAT